MADQAGGEWQRLGEDVGRAVQDAISSGNYSNLSREMADIADRALGNLGDTIASKVKESTSQSRQRVVDEPTEDWHEGASTMRDIHGYSGSEYRQFTPDPEWQDTKTAKYIKQINKDHAKDKLREEKRKKNELYEKTGVWKGLSIAGIAAGFPLGIILAGFFGALSAAVNPLFLAPMILTSVPLFGVGIAGTSMLSQINRFERYVESLDGRTYGDIAMLSQAGGRSKRGTVKDLTKMIGRRWFKQGHIDEDTTCLITSDETYDQYLLTQKQALAIRQQEEEEQRKEEEQRLKEDAEYAAMTESQREIFRQGEAYIKELHECNDAIPGHEMSEKVSRMEISVRQILDRARKQPRLIEDLRRLMNYYLPTTVKLLHAYAELESQGKDTETIRKSKSEIEETIDIMNDAFDKLFDNMFVDTSLDISTDAEVMKTLLKQEGLTGHSFTSAGMDQNNHN
ncbi:MAG: 5-bromo-4-chloroindolyl phosphate hydrolysis family protein [Lachnospiraceae bacterium]|nr:5-bromo-4-chloroindolyl phosphate hydrolysis family protein [Lachnospiraceae bacterium]